MRRSRTGPRAAEGGAGDMVLTLGTGSVSQLGPMVLEQLNKKQAALKEAAGY